MKHSVLSRRDWLKSSATLGLAAAGAALAPRQAAGQENGKRGVIDIGSRRELFVDHFLIDTLDGARRILHSPTPQEVSLVRNRPWEGNVSGYTTVFRDGAVFRMYYRGTDTVYTEGKVTSPHREVVCYAESADGIRWRRPELGLVEFEGSKKNNIIWDGVGSHNFTPFRDTNPGCADDAKYKAFGSGGGGKRGLYAFQSADGIHWRLIRTGESSKRNLLRKGRRTSFRSTSAKRVASRTAIGFDATRSASTVSFRYGPRCPAANW